MARAMPTAEFRARTFKFACQIVDLYKALTKVPDMPLVIARQLLRSGTSIGANIEEATASSSRRDLIARTGIALREARETKFWLRLVSTTRLAPPGLLRDALKEVDELVAMLTVSLRNLKSE